MKGRNGDLGGQLTVALALLFVGLLFILQGCRQADSVVLLNVEAATGVPTVTALRVTMSTASAHDARNFPAQVSAKPVAFPASLALVIPRARAGRLDLVVEGLDANGKTVGRGTAQTLIVVGGKANASTTLTVFSMLCGNGVVDPGESCDDSNLFSFDGCDYRCQAEGAQLDAGLVYDATVEMASLADVADAPDDLAFAESGRDSSLADISPLDAAVPDAPYVADGALDLPATGTGGTPGSGGVAATGGTTGAGGSFGSGGAPGIDGATETDGDHGTDGMAGTGGIAGTGGVAGAGGLLGTGGIVDTGGAAGTGGILGTGGVVGTGGIVGTGGNGSGGASGTGGTGGVGTPAGTPGQSCSGMAPTCGPYGNESCCASLLVPGGTFYRSYDGVDFTDKGFPATVSDFALDRYEVTVGRFRAFVNAGKGTKANPPAAGDGLHPLIPASGWDATWNTNLLADTGSLSTALKCDPGNATWTASAGVSENRPMNCVLWYEAFAFCAWDGGRLPTEAEWNYAASGGSEQRYYPWSNPPTSTLIDTTYAVYSASGTNAQVVGSKSPKGDGKWGHADLGGNEFELVLDWFVSPYAQNICTNCANLTPTDIKVVRGGGFLDLPRSADRAIAGPTYRNYDVGFRCARAK